ncbi:MAG TPA: hypothetical protein DDX07_08080, partial [Porphyromonadaceae bacterium]|nr:hypothetical protein [Porphyromonadaceae bacterium]
VREGEKPRIEDFSVESIYYDATSGAWQSGGDITDMLLSDPSYTFLMVSYLLEEMNMRHLQLFREADRYAKEKGYSFYLLTASDANVVGNWEQQNRTGFQFAHADERTLKTMIRSNPGLMLLKEGTVIGKWDDSKVPSFDKFQLIIK